MLRNESQLELYCFGLAVLWKAAERRDRGETESISNQKNSGDYLLN